MIGPEVKITKSCFPCECCEKEIYAVQSDSGIIYSCTHKSIERTRIGNDICITPDWCPVDSKGSNVEVSGK